MSWVVSVGADTPLALGSQLDTDGEVASSWKMQWNMSNLEKGWSGLLYEQEEVP